MGALLPKTKKQEKMSGSLRSPRSKKKDTPLRPPKGGNVNCPS